MDELFRLVLVELPGPDVDTATADRLARYRVGGVVLFRKNLPSSAHAAGLCLELHRHIPDPILAVDQEGGTVARLLDLPLCPGAMALGAARDPALTEAVGAAVARGLRPLGFNLNFAPVADVNSNPENPVIGSRSFGSEPLEVAAHVGAFVRGHQREGVAACAKHFPGHGDTRVDSHHDLPVLPYTLERLEAVELPPFRAAVAAGCATIMPGHLLAEQLDSRPATVSTILLQDLLRGQLGFTGVTVTDALNMGGITRSFGPRAAAEALAAGADLLLILGDPEAQVEALEELRRAALDGRIPARRIAEALQRVEALRRCFPSRPEAPRSLEADYRLMEHAAAQSVTRLGDFPPLRQDESLLLLASASTASTALAAVDQDSVAAEVYRALQSGHPRCRLLCYPPDATPEATAALLEECRQADRVLWLSSSRFRPTPAEHDLASRVAGVARSMIHLAVSSPYAALDLAIPALLTYGFRLPSLQALLLALQDPAACSGRLPVTT